MTDRQGRTLRARVEAIPMLASLLLEAWDELAPHLQVASFSAGDVLVTQGDDATELYAVLSGDLDVILVHDEGEQSITRLSAGDVVGEIAMVTGGTRNATIRAATDVEVVEIGRDGLAVLTAHPDAALVLTARATLRMRQTDLIAQLVKMFGAANVELLRELEERLEWIRLPAGAELFRQGDPPDAAWFVVSGRLHVLTESPGDQGKVRHVGRGQLVGDLELVDLNPRGSTVRAARDSDLVRLPADVFDELLGRHPAVMLEVARSILRRNRAPAHRPEVEMSIAVVPGRGDIDIRPLAAALTRALSGFGPAMHLSAARVDDLVGRDGAAIAEPGGPTDLHVNHQLERIQHGNRFVVYEADAQWSPWTRRGVGQSDRVLVVADGAVPAATRVDSSVAANLAHRAIDSSLVLLQDPALDHPVGTHLDAVAGLYGDHHHVRHGSNEDVERLARILAGRAVGLVLGGGGARGFAHLGVIRAMGELGVPIDQVAGTSMGGVMATAPALEYTPDQALEETTRQFAGLLDYTLPVASLLRGRRMVRKLRQTYGDSMIEDFWKGYFCVSTNLTRSCPVVHQRGPIVTALRATAAIPGVLPPVVIDGEYLVDGGILDNLPVEKMRSINQPGTVIAIDVAPGSGPRARLDYGLSLSGWQALRRRRVHLGIVATLVRATLVGSLHDRDRIVAEGVADLYLDLDLRGIGLLDFKAVGPVADRGYEAAAPRLEAWLGGLEHRLWEPTKAGQTGRHLAVSDAI